MLCDAEKKEVRVGIADASYILAPGTIATIGLGSCVGILFYDTNKKLAALAHIMLPDSTSFKNVTNPYKFADTTIPLVLEELKARGSLKRNVICKIAGGASMFKFSDKSINSDIGNRNINAVKEGLEKVGLKIVSEHVGGSKGRSMIVDAETGEVTIKVIGECIIKI